MMKKSLLQDHYLSYVHCMKKALNENNLELLGELLTEMNIFAGIDFASYSGYIFRAECSHKWIDGKPATRWFGISTSKDGDVIHYYGDSLKELWNNFCDQLPE